MPLQADTISIPISKGVNLTSEARLLDPPTLLEATNSRFPRGGGSTKRRGHTEEVLRGEAPIPPGVDVDSLPWVLGWGYLTGNRPDAVSDAAACGVGPHPDAGRIYGQGTRDQETLLWSGHRLYSYTPSQLSTSGRVSAEIGNALMPTLQAYPLGKVQTPQTQPCFVDNGALKLVAWVDSGSSQVRYSVYDSESRAPLVVNKTLGVGVITTATHVQVFSLGVYLHFLVTDSGDGLLKCFSLAQSDVNTENYHSYGPCAGYFDYFKVDETHAALLINVDTSILRFCYLGLSGGVASVVTDYVAGVSNLTSVALAQHSTASELLIAALKGSKPTISTIGTDGTVVQAFADYDPGYNCINLTVAPKYVLSHTGHPLYDVYLDSANAAAGNSGTVVRVRWSNGAVVGSKLERFNLQLISKAFVSGDRTLVWAGHYNALQSTWVLLDELLLPTGKLDQFVANVPSYAVSAAPYLTGVNFSSAGTGTKFHLALGFRVRVPASTTSVNVYTEPSIHVVELDTLPKLMSAQAGRCTYFAGAQLWTYDGVTLAEQGFHWGPETVATLQTGGALSNPGTYSYRVDLCYRNAQNEEVRSLSILTPSVATTSGDKKFSLAIPTIPTRRSGSYFLIFRNANASGVPLTNWWLLNSRDPSATSFLPNDLTQATVTFVDTGSVDDVTIQNNELHPAALDTYLQPLSSPACELVSAGHDRVWVAGGELSPGQVAPSRLFDPGDSPAFNPYLNIQVDRSAQPITAIGFVGEISAFFQLTQTYVMDGDGPDNNSSGLWAPARLALADLGATSQYSLGLITQGLVFQSPAGFRLLGPGGAIQPVGQPVDLASKIADVFSTVVVDSDQEIRWYGAGQSFVYNYLYDIWSVWTVDAVGASYNLATGLALVTKSDGRVWVETEGVWTDGPTPYTHRVRLPWLHAGQLGDFQRIRYISGLGRPYDPTNPNHNIRVELFYDELPSWDERFDWTYPDASNNSDTWGSGNWGDGAWGDTTAIVTSKDLSWEWMRRPSRQKCGVISIAVEDAGTPGPGFVLNAISLRLARKPGLNRTPARGGTDTYKG